MKRLNVWFLMWFAILGLLVSLVFDLHAQTPPDGLVASYGLEEGSGSLASDASGNANTGIISGATWTTPGWYGNALSFNSKGSRVNIEDADALKLNSEMTLEAWVYITKKAGWKTVISKKKPKGLSYALYVSGLRPVAFISLGKKQYKVKGTEKLPMNTWVHLAATYDGATLQLYVDGNQAGSRMAVGDPIATSDNPVSIGADEIFGKKQFWGSIDEVRIYNRALSQAEIQNDLNAPVSPPDTELPTAPSGLTATAVSSTRIDLSWTASTDNVGVTGYQVERCQGAGCSNFSLVTTVAGTTYSNTGLLETTSYSYRVRATDGAGNLSDYSSPASATTLDGTIPTVTAFTIPSTATTLTVPITTFTVTDNVAVTGYLVNESSSPPSPGAAGWSATAQTSYTFTTEGAKTLYAWAKDAANNVSTSRSASVVITLPDTTAPTVTAFTIPSTATTLTVSITSFTATDNVGVTGHLVTESATAPLAGASGWSATAQTSYTFSTAGTKTLYAWAKDAANNVSASMSDSVTITLPDTTPPTISSVSPGNGASGISIDTNVTATFSEAMDPTTISAGTFELRNPSNTLVPAVVTYNTSSRTATLDPSAQLAYSTTYTATVKGGTSGVKDLVGNPLVGNYVWSFSTEAAATGPEPSGWYAGDMHVHRSCGGPAEAVSSLYSKMSTQNLAVISLLADMGNGEVQNPVTDLPLVTGGDDPISNSERIVHWDAEWHWDAVYNQYPHQALGGHVVALGLSEADQIWEEYTYPIFEWARQQNAIAGFVHMQYLDNNIPQTLDCCTPIEYPVEVALGSADFIAQDVHGSDTAVQAYYRLLNTGFRPSFVAGTDYPCGVSELGSLLTYAQVTGGVMTYGNWIDGIKNGKTVVSRNGHNEFLNLVVNNTATPGHEINLPSAGSVPVTVTWTANQNLSGTIELVHNGIVVASKSTSVTSTSPDSLTATVNLTKSGWLAARRMDSNGHVVHTGAVFVIVNGAPIRASAEDANFYVDWMDNLLTKTSVGGEWNSYFPNNLAEAQARYQAAKTIYQQRAVEAGQ